MAKLYKSGEDYLEMILMLHLKQSYVRAVDVAHELEVSKPSVSRAMGILRDGGFIRIAEDGNILLTQTGSEVAERIYERHTLLTEILVRLGVDRKTAVEDACKMEHYISNVSFDAIKHHMSEYG